MKFFYTISAIVAADLRKLKHDPSELFTRMFQPIFWILIFGQAMAKTLSLDIGQTSYLDFIIPGILAQSILLVAIFHGMAIISERDAGSLHKTLVTPAPRISIIIGKSIAAGGVRGFAQVVVVYILAWILKVDLRFSAVDFLLVLCTVLLFGALFSTLSLALASLVKKRERFLGVNQMVVMPIFFASNALYPLDLMPSWIRAFSLANPLSYQVDAFRSLMICGQGSHFGLLLDFGYGLGVYCVLILIAAWLFPRILY